MQKTTKFHKTHHCSDISSKSIRHCADGHVNEAVKGHCLVIDRNNKVRELPPACCPVTQLLGRSGGTGGRGAALGHGPSGREREGSCQLYRTGEVIRRWLDGWAGSMSDWDAAAWAGPMLNWDVAGWACPMLNWEVAGWAGLMSDGDAAGWACPMLDGDAAVWVAPTLGSAVFSMSSKMFYKKRTEVAVSGGKGLKVCMQLPVEIACASL